MGYILRPYIEHVLTLDLASIVLLVYHLSTIYFFEERNLIIKKNKFIYYKWQELDGGEKKLRTLGRIRGDALRIHTDVQRIHTNVYLGFLGGRTRKRRRGGKFRRMKGGGNDCDQCKCVDKEKFRDVGHKGHKQDS